MFQAKFGMGWKLGLLALLAIGSPVWARRGGPDPKFNGSTASGGMDCTDCHSGTAGLGSVQILGAPTEGYVPNALYPLTVRVSDSAQKGAGFQFSAEDPLGNHVGTLVITDSVNTQLNSFNPNWINHTEAGVDDSVTNWSSMGNKADFNFAWRAPTDYVGAVTFWAAGNAINDNHSLNGDFIYLTNETAANAVPAVSQWGLLVLTLLTASAATLVIVRRKPRTAIVHPRR